MERRKTPRKDWVISKDDVGRSVLEWKVDPLRDEAHGVRSVRTHLRFSQAPRRRRSSTLEDERAKRDAARELQPVRHAADRANGQEVSSDCSSRRSARQKENPRPYRTGGFAFKSLAMTYSRVG